MFRMILMIFDGLFFICCFPTGPDCSARPGRFATGHVARPGWCTTSNTLTFNLHCSDCFAEISDFANIHIYLHLFRMLSDFVSDFRFFPRCSVVCFSDCCSVFVFVLFFFSFSFCLFYFSVFFCCSDVSEFVPFLFSVFQNFSFFFRFPDFCSEVFSLFSVVLLFWFSVFFCTFRF